MKTKKGYTLRSLGNEYILVAESLDEAIDFSRMISLNATAAFLWKEVEDKEFDTEMLASLLMEEYGITHDVAANDVASLLETLKTANLIEY
jgi:hypothetical protein